MNNPNNHAAFTTDAISDNEVIARILGGEKDLYAVLVRRYNQRLYRVALSVMTDETEVEDLMQIAYLKAFENLEKFEHKSSFSTWLTRILINECLQRIKKRKQSLIMNDDLLQNEVSKHGSDKPQTPLTNMLNSELKFALENAINQLPEKYKTVFVMRELENMTVAETQECLNLSEVNVKVRLNRAKALLRTSLSSFYKKEDILHFHLSRCDRVTENVMKKLKDQN